MKRIPNQTVSELIRLVPVLIENIPPGKSTRVDNAVRLTKKIINKLKTLEDEGHHVSGNPDRTTGANSER